MTMRHTVNVFSIGDRFARRPVVIIVRPKFTFLTNWTLYITIVTENDLLHFYFINIDNVLIYTMYL